MCGRLNIYNPNLVASVLQQVGLPAIAAHEPRYNVSPMARLEVITKNLKVEQQTWSIEFGNFRHPNTKVSTLERRKDLQELLLRHRCVVPVNRFYEWPDPKIRPKYKNVKTRFCISNADDVIFLAGISKQKHDGTTQFNILTTEPNDIINDFHHRMPVWLPKHSVNDFLNADTLPELYPYLVPYPDEILIYECDPYVNNGRHEGPQCMQALRSWSQLQSDLANNP